MVSNDLYPTWSFQNKKRAAKLILDALYAICCHPSVFAAAEASEALDPADIADPFTIFAALYRRRFFEEFSLFYLADDAFTLACL